MIYENKNNETCKNNEHGKRINLVSVKLVKEKSISYLPRVISCPSDVASLFSKFIADSDREQFMLCCLNTKNQPTDISIISTGCLDSTVVHPREVFKVAILSNSASIIIAHNHPSGDTEPSKEDKCITNRINEVAKILGIRLIDHIIIGDCSYLSFKEHDIL
ncbi:DNA repair protein RadC [Sedimentibacter sp. zth1]|uniref:JAB domain-containing protein n=1 Tax=Sedimentibacter sp. zth1 TaxID=2816908 RepID=UPI001A92F138|nr:JAB domain-containing protein [Sedimentibacter sp. zth1]QSX04798.1 DNA repair protein RadC [Sedimentibacter sp. zth1]